MMVDTNEKLSLVDVVRARRCHHSDSDDFGFGNQIGVGKSSKFWLHNSVA